MMQRDLMTEGEIPFVSDSLLVTRLGGGGGGRGGGGGGGGGQLHRVTSGQTA